MADAIAIQPNMLERTEEWYDLPWAKLERNVFRLQKRIYKAVRRGDFKCVRNLQRLLLRSFSARALATRRVTQDNRGKRTAGIDGIANLPPPQRLRYVSLLRHLDYQPQPIRRTYIDKRNSTEKRPLGIPTMFDRAMQALVKLALEPEWEAKFEPNSYGFRPGRGCHDAIEAIFNYTRLKPKFVLDADIEKCFDRIDHDKLMTKLSAIPAIAKLIRGWLKAGIFEKGELSPSEAGTPQGGVISPLLMNIALHGFETDLVSSFPKEVKPALIRYADDFVILHHDLDTLLQLRQRAEEWLAELGLNLKESKTRITHTLYEHEGNIGFDFLGFNIRQFKTGKHIVRRGYRTAITPSKDAQKRHLAEMAEVVQQYRGAPQTALIAKLNPKVRGWTNYYRACSTAWVMPRMDHLIYKKLRSWAKWRHPRKSGYWRYQRYWPRHRGRIVFSDSRISLVKYIDVKRQPHVKVKGDKSPFDGDWLYWAIRLGRDPTKPQRLVVLLRKQHGKCHKCGLRFRADDVMEVHHIDQNKKNNALENLALLHGHCHDQAHRNRCS